MGILKTPLREKINFFFPNGHFYEAKQIRDVITAKSVFYTDWRYSKRIYYSFLWLWWVLHFWDWLIADRYLPKLSFGFFTLTQSPDPGSGQVTCDGSIYIYNREMTSVQLLSEDTTGPYNSYIQTDYGESEFTRVICNSTPINTFNGLSKSFFFFDTSSLGPNSSLNSGKLSIYVTKYLGPVTMGMGKMGLYSANGTVYNNALVVTDYFNVGTISLSNDMIVETIQYYANNEWYYALKEPRYYGYILNSNGISNINKTSISKFAVRFTFDSFGWVAGKYHMLVGYFADSPAGYPPILEIEFTIPSTNKIQMII